MQLGIAAFLVAFSMVAHAMPAKVLRVIDGDTIEVDAALWLFVGDQAQQMRGTVSVRLIGIDTPEKRSAQACERDMALRATEFARAWFDTAAGAGVSSLTQGTQSVIAPIVDLQVVHLDKYAGRVLGHVMKDGKSLADALIAAGLGRPYGGGSRSGWC
jgi:endonuclease YncB( thermonuclease family)